MIKTNNPSYITSLLEFLCHLQFTQIYLSIRSYHKYIMLNHFKLYLIWCFNISICLERKEMEGEETRGEGES